MWVKTNSGSLCNLIKASDIVVYENKHGKFVVIALLTNNDDTVLAGSFDTREEAQEVIDQIWDAMGLKAIYEVAEEDDDFVEQGMGDPS